MSERGAEGILRRQKEEAARQAAQKPAQPVDKGTAGHTSGRVSSAAKGAAGGAVAGPEGALAGAITGALSGGKGRSGGNKALVAEFAICMAVLALSPLVDKGGDVTVGKWMKKGSATAAVFVVLGFVSASGQTGRKVASGLGLLVTLTVLLNERSIFGTLVQAVSGQPVATSHAGAAGGTHDLSAPAQIAESANADGQAAVNVGTALDGQGVFGGIAGIGSSIGYDLGAQVHPQLVQFAHDVGDDLRRLFGGD